MKHIRRTFTILSTLLACLIFVPVALAHPLGNFTVNHYAGLQISREKIVIDYVMDLAEIPAFQEIELLDANGNRQPDPDEIQGYHAVRCASLQPSLNLSINGKASALSLVSSSMDFPAGVGGLLTMRLTCAFEASIDASQDSVALSFQNNVFADRLGWQEIVVTPDGVTVQGEYSSTSVSNRLTSYPDDLLTSPLEQRAIDLEIAPLGLAMQNQPSVPVMPGNASKRDDAFTRLILLDEITLPTLLLALGISFLWGAAHAMTPGHGKTIVGAYLVGSRGTLKHALYLGLTTTVTHTLGVFALGLVTLFAAQYIVPEMLYPWMSLLSGLFVVGIGINLFVSRFKSSGIVLPRIESNVKKSALSPVFEHSHAERSGHSHKYVLNMSASSEHLHIHDHDQPHVHRHGVHPHAHDHSHGDHSHMPPDQITWRNLLALGVSGGLIPCPSALVVLLGAIALNKIGFGLILVLAFSLGLAATLTAIGMLFIYAGRLFQRFPTQGRVIRLLPVLSALFVSVIGAALIWKALGEMGIT
jgi:ABC-type nickel/cobalt efflux system permease component RcnA